MDQNRKLSIVAGLSYLVIFFAALFANFFVLEQILQEPLLTINENHWLVRLGIIAFLITVVFDVVVAWALYKFYHNHNLTGLSTLFRMMHAAIMGVAIFALVVSLSATTTVEIYHYVSIFNTIWLIGLLFFGIHLFLLGSIIKKPRFISLFLIIAGVMYVIDTCAHFLLPNYDDHASLFLISVALPSILGEMSLAIWLLFKGGRNT